MRKWLAALGVLLLVALALLWRELDPSSRTAPGQPAPVQVARAPAKGAAKRAGIRPAPTDAAAEPIAVVDPSTDKIDPQSDEFIIKHDDLVIPMMMREAVKCWENLSPERRAQFHRNQNLVAKFKQRIRDGVVTIVDLEVERSNIGDPALEACFLQQLRSTTWTNPRLPEWDQEDMIKLGPRTLKKYTRENREADGPEAPPQ